ncbi:MAG: methyltransferase domain-containing protein [bacterium]|nr:methyltransferase domain-containing protein [bacterium]
MMNRFNFYAPVYDSFMKRFHLYKPELIIEHLEPKSDQVILDLAGGTGYIASTISPLVKKTVVVDASVKMLKKASQYPGLELCNADAYNTPFPDKSFDSIICIDALHHIKRVEETAAEMARLLKDNGKVVILDFDLKGPAGALVWFLEKVYIDNSRFFSPQELSAIFAENGISGETIPVKKVEFLFVGRKHA